MTSKHVKAGNEAYQKHDFIEIQTFAKIQYSAPNLTSPFWIIKMLGKNLKFHTHNFNFTQTVFEFWFFQF